MQSWGKSTFQIQQGGRGTVLGKRRTSQISWQQNRKAKMKQSRTCESSASDRVEWREAAVGWLSRVELDSWKLREQW